MELRTAAPVNFVHLSDVGADPSAIAGFERRMQDDERFRTVMSRRGDLAWNAQAFFRLRERGYRNIRLSRQPDRAAINIVHSDDLRMLGPDAHRFDVCVRADYPHRLWAHYSIVQNQDQAGASSAFVCHFPQTGLIARRAPAGRLRRLGYFGHVTNNLVWGLDRWARFAAANDLEFVVPPADQWHDYADVDVVMGIRSFGPDRHPRKPPSKLLNAWITGVPFIGGADSAFRQIGTPGEDYLLATSPAEVADAIRRLRTESGLRDRLVANGARRAQAFTAERIVDRWIELIEGPIAERHLAWRSSPTGEAARVAALAIADRAFTAAKHGARKAQLALTGR